MGNILHWPLKYAVLSGAAGRSQSNSVDARTAKVNVSNQKMARTLPNEPSILKSSITSSESLSTTRCSYPKGKRTRLDVCVGYPSVIWHLRWYGSPMTRSHTRVSNNTDLSLAHYICWVVCQTGSPQNMTNWGTTEANMKVTVCRYLRQDPWINSGMNPWKGLYWTW